MTSPSCLSWFGTLRLPPYTKMFGGERVNEQVEKQAQSALSLQLQMQVVTVHDNERNV